MMSTNKYFMFKFLFLIYLLSVTTFVFAPPHPLSIGPDGILLYPPKCVTTTGEPVNYYKVSAEVIWNQGASLSLASQNPVKKEFYVLMDRDNFGILPPEHQLQILFHECSHHMLGHTQVSSYEATKIGGVDLVEQNADCHSFTTLVNWGFDDEFFEVVYDSMLTLDQQISTAPPSKRINAYAAAAYKLTPTQRVEYAKICVLEAKRGTEHDEY